jgi:hypothetical protein
VAEAVELGNLVGSMGVRAVADAGKSGLEGSGAVEGGGNGVEGGEKIEAGGVEGAEVGAKVLSEVGTGSEGIACRESISEGLVDLRGRGVHGVELTGKRGMLRCSALLKFGLHIALAQAHTGEQLAQLTCVLHIFRLLHQTPLLQRHPSSDNSLGLTSFTQLERRFVRATFIAGFHL